MLSNRAKLFTAGAVGFVLAGAIMYLVQGSFFGPPERLTTAIVLAPDPTTLVCRPTDPVALWAKSNKRRTVTWSITNNCAAAEAIQLRNFREKNPDGTLGPPVTLFDPATPPPTSTLIAAGGTVNLPATLQHPNGNLARHIFKYEIWIGATVDPALMQLGRDPDIETWD